eukprot:10248822-Prorocentrum_lima.AAC.1
MVQEQGKVVNVLLVAGNEELRRETLISASKGAAMRDHRGDGSKLRSKTMKQPDLKCMEDGTTGRSRRASLL